VRAATRVRCSWPSATFREPRIPARNGNVGLAGHRDTFFRRLRNIKADDEIRVVTQSGHVRVSRAAHQHRQAQGRMGARPDGHPTLTLVTCYPFTYIGSAPQRFIVRASLAGPTQTVALR
jgi:sortase A